MTEFKSRGPVRRFVTRVMAAGALLSIYAASTIGMTGVSMVTGMTSAHAQRGRGRGGRGRGRLDRLVSRRVVSET